MSVSPASLTFTTSNWDTAQTVTLTGVNDSDSETVTISHSVSGYGSVTAAAAVTVSVEDAGNPDALRVTSIERQTPGVSPTDADSLAWRITFSEAVTNVDAADFEVSGSTAMVTNLEPVSGETGVYDVTVSGGDLADVNGEVRLGFASGQDIEDEAGNALSITTPTGTSANSYVVDNTVPPVEPTDPNAPRVELASLVGGKTTLILSEAATFTGLKTSGDLKEAFTVTVDGEEQGVLFVHSRGSRNFHIRRSSLSPRWCWVMIRVRPGLMRLRMRTSIAWGRSVEFS